MIDWPDDNMDDLIEVVDQLTSRPSVQSLRDVGLTDLCLPEAAGGLGLGGLALARVLERLAFRCGGAAARLFGQAVAQLAWFGPAQPDVLASMPGLDWAWPGFHGLMRHDWPGADHQGRLSGRLKACIGGDEASLLVTPVRLPNGQAAIALLSLNQAGVERQTSTRFMGLQSAGLADLNLAQASAQLHCDDVSARLNWLSNQMATCTMAMMCGLMRGSLQTARSYAEERHQGGGSLLGWGEVRRLLAVQHERLSSAQSGLSSALRTLDQGAAHPQAASHVQALLLQCGEAATALTTDGVQLLGGNGYMKDYGQAQRMCDAWQLHGLLGPAAQRRQDLLTMCLQAE